jgi:hypothetical protein
VERTSSAELLPQNLFHRLSPCQLIDQLVQVADFPHEWFFNVLYSDTADHAFVSISDFVRPFFSAFVT